MRQIIPLSQNRQLIAAYSKAARPSRRWLVFLTESGAEFQPATRAEAKTLLGDLAEEFNYLVINKPGLNPSGKDRVAFEHSFRRGLRISDALEAMRVVVPAGDKIYLVGYSEGAYLAPEVAIRDARVQALVMVGGGTRGWLKEELSNAGSREKIALRRQIAKIQKQPRALTKWNGFSYATWNSYRSDSTLAALKRLKIPALSILGEKDKVIDLKATLRDLSRMKKVDLTLLPDHGHELAWNWDSVTPHLREFLRIQLP
jgi:pimeloyl-ACP methyl ester carboxylesterase